MLLAIVALMGCASSSGGQPEPGEVSNEVLNGVYSVEQAQRGREAFTEVCRECHSSSEFRGRAFEFTWRRRTAWDLYRELRRTMPEDFPDDPETAHFYRTLYDFMEQRGERNCLRLCFFFFAWRYGVVHGAFHSCVTTLTVAI